MAHLVIMSRSILRSCLLFLAGAALVSCTTVNSSSVARGNYRGGMRPFFAGAPGMLRVGAKIEDNPYERPFLRRPAGRHPQAPPYGLAAAKVITSHLQNARIPGAPRTAPRGAFDAVAYIYPEPFREYSSGDGITAETPFTVDFRSPDGRSFSRILVTGIASTPRGYDPIRQSLDDAGRKIAAAVIQASQAQRPKWVGGGGDDADSLASLGVAQFSAKDFDGALLYFEKAVTTRPDHQSAWAYRGATLIKLGRSEEGRQSLEHAIQLEPNSAEAEQARKWLERITRI